MTPVDRRTPPSISGRHVLVVEDEAIIAFAVLDDLEGFGAVPHGPCLNVASAMTSIHRTRHLDGVLLATRLKGEPSVAVVDELRRRGIPFVFLTCDHVTVSDRHRGVPTYSKLADIGDVLHGLAALMADGRTAPA